MDYCFKERGINGSLYDLLSYNREKRDGYRSKMRAPLQLGLGQSFREAGERFQVIDDQDTVTMLVPYKEAQMYIEQWKEGLEYSERKRLLRRLQRFTINVFRTDKLLAELVDRGGLEVFDENYGLFCVNRSFYSEERGLQVGMGLLCL